jgi:hypothetical protein
VIETVGPEIVAGRIQRRIRPPANAHISIIGGSGCGKDYLARYLLETARPAERAIVLDVTGWPDGDPAWDGWGDDMAEMPSQLPAGGRVRVITQLGPEGAKAARNVIRYARHIGRVALVLGDTGDVTETEGGREGMGLSGPVDRMLSGTRKRGTMVLACSTSAKYASASVQDQPRCFLLGYTAGSGIDALITAAGLARRPERPEVAAVLRDLPPWRFLYVDYADGPPLLGITQAPPPAARSPQRALQLAPRTDTHRAARQEMKTKEKE